MRRTGEHIHTCRNKVHGCTATWTCPNRNLESNYDGFPDPVCGVNPSDDWECQDCDASRCSECGSVLNVEPHDTDCAKAAAVHA